MKKLLVLLFCLFTYSAFAGGLPGTLNGMESGNSLPIVGGTLTGDLVSTKQILMASGTDALPSLAFMTDTNTGINHILANTIRFVCDGTYRAQVQSTGLYVVNSIFSAGGVDAGAPQMNGVTASNVIPGFTFVGSTNTGLGRAAVGQPSFIASGVEVLRGVVGAAYFQNGVYLASTTASSSDFAVLSRKEIQDYVSEAVSGNSLLYYLAEVDGAFANYESLQNAPVANLASDTAVTVGAAQVLGDQWITATGSPNLTTLRDAVYNVSQHVTKGAGSDLVITYELGKVSAAGDYTFVASSPPITLITDNFEHIVDANISVTTPVTILATDFLAIRQYAIRSGAVDTTLVNWYGGAKQAFLNVPVIGGVFMRTDGSNAQTTTLANLGAWYTGNPIFSDNSASMTLPVNGSALSIAVADGQCGFINADVEGKWATGTTFVHVNLSAAYENFGNTLALIGSPASTTNALNAATYSASISVTDNVIKVIGSGDVGAEWVVKKLEVK